MAINRAQLVKELVPGLHALFGLEYDRYDAEYEEIFETETSERAFEEEVMLTGFGEAPVKFEGSGVTYDTAQESFTARSPDRHCRCHRWNREGSSTADVFIQDTFSVSRRSICCQAGISTSY